MISSPDRDTAPSARAVQLELLRAAPVWRKVEIWGQLIQAARILALSGLSARYPGATEAELRRRLADLLLGADLARDAYGPWPEESHDT